MIFRKTGFAENNHRYSLENINSEKMPAAPAEKSVIKEHSHRGKKEPAAFIKP